MRLLNTLIGFSFIGLAVGLLQGCGESKSEVGVSPEFRKADLASQDAMREYMQGQNNGKAKGKARKAR